MVGSTILGFAAGIGAREAGPAMTSRPLTVPVQAVIVSDDYGVGDWSGGKQLFCAAARGGVITLNLPIAREGIYRVMVYATLAPDFGVVRCAVNGESCGPPTDLYAPIVLPTGPIHLGRVQLPRGTSQLSFEVTGKHASSNGYRFGIDAVELTRAAR